MTLSEEARERLADVVALQPTKNAELQARWDMDSGSEVHNYLESELDEYYYRDENSLICATPDAADIVGEQVDGDDGRVVTLPALQVDVIAAVPDADEQPDSVVSVLHRVRDAGVETDVEAVRSALRSLHEKGIVERVQRTVPTYRLGVDREKLEVRPLDGD